MAVEVLAVSISLAGVVVGGGLSFFIQRYTQRHAERIEAKRHQLAWAEARRAESIAVVERVLTNAQAAERVAADRHVRGEEASDWRVRADEAMARLWVAEKMTYVVCSTELHEAAHTFANNLNSALHQAAGELELWQYLAPGRTAFLDAARAELETPVVLPFDRGD